MNTNVICLKGIPVLASLFLTVSCDIVPEYPSESFVGLRLEYAGITKVQNPEDDTESAVGSVSYFIFDEDGVMEASVGSNASGSRTEAKVRNGHKTVYALVNCPEQTVIENESELLERVSFLKDNRPDHLAMTGCVEVDVENDMEISVKVRRITGKIVIKEVAVAFEGTEQERIKINDIYLTNVNPSLTYGGEYASEPDKWLNISGMWGSEADILLHDAVDSTIMDGCSYSLAHRFYTYPNGTDICTKLVISTDMGFYCIDLPDVRSNTAFIIRKVTIHGKGSENPEEEPETGVSCSVELYVTDWTDGEYINEMI